MAGDSERSLLTIQHRPDRHVTYGELHPFAYDDTLQCWCVFDKGMIAAILQSDRFHVVPYAEHYREIEQRTGIDFGGIITALDSIPLANEGADHRRLRAEFAAVMGAAGRNAVKATEEYVAALVRDAFAAGSTIDLTDLGAKIYNHVFSLWLGIDQGEIVDKSDFSQVFDRTRSLNRRKQLNQNLTRLIAAFTERHDLSTSPEIAVAMNVVGRDAFVGSIVLSIWETLSRSPGARLSEIAFAESLPATGVPYVERLAQDDATLGGMTVRKGDRLRVFLDATARYVSGEEANLLFGKGRHLCLGKPMTLVVWRALVATAGTLSARFTPVEFRMREGDYVFSYPDRAVVRFHE
ncbi:MAG TPA: hypothetical protein VFK86_03490 [Bauldia sp.]|nr:hypothetical protein [Bauldia sp.]